MHTYFFIDYTKTLDKVQQQDQFKQWDLDLFGKDITIIQKVY